MRKKKVERVVGYVRTSTELESQKESITNQKSRINSYCKGKGWKLEKIFSDKGASGSNIERGGFMEMMEYVKNQGVDAIIVTNNDRFSRDPRDMINQIDRLNNWGVDYVAIDQNIDTSTTAGEMMLVMISYLNRMEREKTVEKIVNVLKEKSNRGEPLGRPPYGLMYSKRKDRLIPGKKFEKSLEVIKLREQGRTYPQIERETEVPSSTAQRIIKRKGIYESIRHMSRRGD